MNPFSRDTVQPGWLGDDRVHGALRPLIAFGRQFSMWFWLIVIIPTALAGIYLFFIASDIYASETRFIVRSPGRQAGGLSSILQSVSSAAGAGAGGAEDSYAVESFITSRDAAANLEKKDNLRAIYARPESDYLTRFPNIVTGDSFEALYWHYQHFIDVTVDSTTGVTTLEALSYRPADSKAIASALLRYSEKLVNDLNMRAENDAISQASRQIAEAERKLATVQKKLTDYRVQAQILDPTLSSTSLYGTMNSVMGVRITTATQLAEMARNSPNNPAIPTLKARLAALDGQLADIARKATGGDASSMAGKLGGYERLKLDEEMAERMLAAATEALETARVEARRQHLYIEHIAEPSLADYPLYPRRLLWFGFVLAATLIIYGIAWLLVAGIREHTSA